MAALSVPVFTKRWLPRIAACEECETLFIMRSPVHRFCSDLCRRKATYGVQPCAHCGEPFVPVGWAETHTRFCSRSCARASRHEDRARA